MKQLLAILWISVLAACSANKAVVDEKGPHYRQDTAWAERAVDSNGNIFMKTHNVRYQFHEVMLTDLPTPVLMKIKEEQSVPLNNRQPKKELQTVTTWRITDTTLVELSRIEIPATNGGLSSRHTNWYNVIHTTPGKESVTTIYNIVNGKRVMDYQGQMAKLLLPKTAVTRYIGFHAIESALPISEPHASTPDLAGILTYAKADGALVQAKLRIKDSRLMDAIKQFPPQVFLVTERMGNEIRSQTMDLWPPQGEDFPTVPTDFYIEINYGKIRSIDPIRIHVLDDKLVLEPQPDERVSLELIP